jgi:hypothetical protein
MSTKSTPRKKTTGTTNTKSPRPRTKAAAGGKATSKKKAASATAGAETDSKPSSAEADSEPAVLANTAAPSAEDENPDEPPNRPNPLTAEQKNLDLLTQIDLALGIKETALLGKKGLVASHNFRISREGCQQLLDWLEHRLDASIAAMKDPREEAMEVEIGNLSTRFRQPPEEQSGGAVPIYGSDMYTLMFYRRGGLWFVAAFNYELNTPYLDFGKWQQDLLAMLSEAGL